MKKATRILSVVMVLILMMSLAVMPANAALPSDAHVSFRLELAPETTRVDGNGEDPVKHNVYKLNIYLTSDKRLATIIMDINFDATKFDLLDACDDYTYTTSRPDDYTAVLCDRQGQLLTDEVVSVGRDKYYGPNHVNVKTAYKFKFDDKADGVMLWNYKPADMSAMIGECTDELVGTVYLQLKAGQTADGAVFSFGSGIGTSSKSVGFCSNPVKTKYINLFSKKNPADVINIMPISLIGTPEYTYGTASVEKSPLEQLSRFWKANTSQFTDGIDFKVRSTITRADLATKLGVEDTGLDAAIKEKVDYVGFAMAENKDIADEDIKLAAQTPGTKVNGATSGQIVAGLNNWVVNDGANIQFGAVVHTAKSHLETTPAFYTAFIVLKDGKVIRYADPIQISASDFRAQA